MSWRLDSLLYPAYPILLDYPINSQPRYGYGKPPHTLLNNLIDSNRNKYVSLLNSFQEFSDDLAAISNENPENTGAPIWCNPYFMGLDAAALYSLLRLKKSAIFSKSDLVIRPNLPGEQLLIIDWTLESYRATHIRVLK